MSRPRITATDSSSSSATPSRRGATLLLLALMLQLLAVPIHLASHHHHHHHGGAPAPSDRDLARWDDPRGACHGDSEHEHEARDHLVPMLNTVPGQASTASRVADFGPLPSAVTAPALSRRSLPESVRAPAPRAHDPRTRQRARAPPQA